MDWIAVAYGKEINAAWNTENFLTSSGTVSFSVKTLLYGVS